ncbi:MULTISPECIES: maleylpyruvate isomerase family mycothiol-dependent enzyme [unclassified Mycobacterium]|uniref:maleylpyruvate isomerase family mycothiol-dependent enzyme n=1 Tax=unclassified Mycobacterium TaxID=2642494 RepID=UPI0029C66E33|nr:MULTISPECIES: maleylpyruvate isomerase family mycothiol-dependent enzyme [unclassified Mycobacterium]
MSVRDLLRANDARFNALARELSAAEWSAPSLCDEWTNHEVLAHLVFGYGGRLGVLVAEMCQHRGSFDGANTELARTLAATRSPAELLEDFARLADRPQGMGRYFPRTLFLGDHVTHELDILHAVGRGPAIPEAALVAVLNAQVTLPNPFVPAFRNSLGLRLIATDADWTHGRGPEVVGRADELVSVLGSRPKMLERLSGDGVAVLADRVSRPSRTAS